MCGLKETNLLPLIAFSIAVTSGLFMIASSSCSVWLADFHVS